MFLDQPGHIDLVVGFVCQNSWPLVFTLPKTERCLEPLLKFRLLHSFGAYRQVVNFNED